MAAGTCPMDVTTGCPSGNGNYGYNNSGGCGNVGCNNVGKSLHSSTCPSLCHQLFSAAFKDVEPCICCQTCLLRSSLQPVMDVSAHQRTKR